MGRIPDIAFPSNTYTHTTSSPPFLTKHPQLQTSDTQFWSQQRECLESPQSAPVLPISPGRTPLPTQSDLEKNASSFSSRYPLWRKALSFTHTSENYSYLKALPLTLLMKKLKRNWRHLVKNPFTKESFPWLFFSHVDCCVFCFRELILNSGSK